MKFVDILDLEDNYIKLYKFTCSLPKEQSYMLSYLIDAERFVSVWLDDDYFEVNKTSFIGKLLTGWSVREIDTALKGLQEAGYISVKTVQVGMRRSTFVKLNVENIQELNEEYKNSSMRNNKNVCCGTYKKHIAEHTKCNIINNNNKEQLINNSICTDDTENNYTKQKEFNNTVENIISYFNDKCNTKFKNNTSATKKLIKKHLNEGFSIEDFKKVIDIKYLDWGENPVRFSNGQMSNEYLRPSTLFGDKFESYVYEALARESSETSLFSSVSNDIDPDVSDLVF